MTSYKRMRPLLGTFVEIGVMAKEEKANKTISQAFEIIEKVQNLLSFHNPNSDLSKINHYGHKGVEVDPISADVLRLALHMTGISNGDFNCTIGGALVHKGILPNHGGVYPDACGCSDDVMMQGCLVTLKRPIRITLDGIAKGYAVDQAVNFLQANGISSGWINAGGDLRVFGDVCLPIYQRKLDNSVHYLGEYSNTAVATSSHDVDYDQRFPGMIVNTNNGIAKTGVWTVKAGLSWLADALTKVASVAETKQAESKVAALGGELIGQN